jgi:histidinol phosphatase-like PHP family hydrolase
LKIDLHVHCSDRSACAVVSEDEQIQAAIASGLDAIVFCDHARLVEKEHLDDLNNNYAPFKIFGGIEITVGIEDLLVIGVHDQCLEQNNWTYPELYGWVQKHEGFIALAHPFRYHEVIDLDLAKYPPDAIELHSPNTSPGFEKEIRDTANQIDAGLLSNSDAHSSKPLGRFYNLLKRNPSDESELVHILKSGEYERYYDTGYMK